jgi:hypothetical protein
VIRNAKQNKKINKRLALICALINAWPVLALNLITSKTSLFQIIILTIWHVYRVMLRHFWPRVIGVHQAAPPNVDK